MKETKVKSKDVYIKAKIRGKDKMKKKINLLNTKYKELEKIMKEIEEMELPIEFYQ